MADLGRLTWEYQEQNQGDQQISNPAPNSGAPAACQAEPHTHIGKKRKPMS